MRHPRACGLIIAAALGISWSAAAADPCDPALVVRTEDPNGYRERGDRCEGLYLQPLAGSAALLIASFTEVFQEFNPRAASHLQLEWKTVDGATPTRLRAYSLIRRQYYRMDAERPAGIRSYSWPTTLLSTLDLSRKSLGVVAWNEVDIGPQSRRVYLPLRIGAGAAPATPGGYELILVANVELTAVFVTLSRVDEDDRVQHSYMSKRPLEYGYYPPQQGIKIPIPGLNQAGVHKLEVSAMQRDRGSSTAEFWFYHPGG